jgi:hypothetical protein
MKAGSGEKSQISQDKEGVRCRNYLILLKVLGLKYQPNRYKWRICHQAKIGYAIPEWYQEIKAMPVIINDQTYYRTNEVCRMVGVSKNTLFRWLKDRIFSDIEYRDWRGWRLFTAAQVESIKAKTNHVQAVTPKG